MTITKTFGIFYYSDFFPDLPQVFADLLFGRITMAERPFHETVVDLLNMLQTLTGVEMSALATFFHNTIIPANHDNISAAWDKLCEKIMPGGDYGVPTALRNKKRKAEAEVQRKCEAGEQQKRTEGRMEVFGL